MAGYRTPQSDRLGYRTPPPRTMLPCSPDAHTPPCARAASSRAVSPLCCGGCAAGDWPRATMLGRRNEPVTCATNLLDKQKSDDDATVTFASPPSPHHIESLRTVRRRVVRPLSRSVRQGLTLHSEWVRKQRCYGDARVPLVGRQRHSHSHPDDCTRTRAIPLATDTYTRTHTT